MFTVYVLHSEKHRKIYIGYTSNLQERVKSHNELGKKRLDNKIQAMGCCVHHTGFVVGGRLTFASVFQFDLKAGNGEVIPTNRYDGRPT